ncbi:UvrD-helicase domain-containing protein [Chitinophaga polysaccharea]|nr:UvrD-helicase domain-containing protein [Chitinophaga polysaccharea]
MIAGAGSGKTTSLIKALSHIVQNHGAKLKMRGQHVACITYTEIAAREIWDDVGNSPLIDVSTIHSFLWKIIRPFQKDIKDWVIERVGEKIKEREERINRSGTRATTKEKLRKEINKLNRQANAVEKVPFFNYGTGSSYDNGILGHDDIIKMAVSYLNSSEVLRKIIGQKYPYIFVDESQDTFPEIVEALSLVRITNGDRFCLGFFGDPMQKIYPSGIGDLPGDREWKIIKKPENFRCSKEVLDVINNIRRTGDGLEQTQGNKTVGSARIFVLPLVDEQQRTEYLRKVQEKCVSISDDQLWLADGHVKILVLVHRMAAKRLKFPKLFAAMNDNAPLSFKNGLTDGSAWPLAFFLKFVLPLATTKLKGDNTMVMRMLRAHSPRLNKEQLKGTEVRQALEQLKVGLDMLVKQLGDGSQSTVLDVLNTLKNTDMVKLDERLIRYMEGNAEETDELEDDEEGKEALSMQNFFAVPAVEFWGYLKYYNNQSPFATQQGVKGAQFDRVITILDDDEGKHAQFSYDKYFGLKELSTDDSKNVKEGKDYVIPRTRRLFYVSCSRAKKHLVVIYYTADVEKAIMNIKRMKIFPEEQIFKVEDLN